MAQLTKCRSCHQPVRMVATARGRTMPVNPDPDDESRGLERTGRGTIALTWNGAVASLRVLRRDEPYDGPLYVSHFATCPEAQRWSKRGTLKGAARAARARVWDGLED